MHDVQCIMCTDVPQVLVFSEFPDTLRAIKSMLPSIGLQSRDLLAGTSGAVVDCNGRWCLRGRAGQGSATRICCVRYEVPAAAAVAAMPAAGSEIEWTGRRNAGVHFLAYQPFACSQTCAQLSQLRRSCLPAPAPLQPPVGRPFASFKPTHPPRSSCCLIERAGRASH
jgi:hypothetical protein